MSARSIALRPGPGPKSVISTLAVTATHEALHRELATRMGTPRYIARAVSKGKLLIRGAPEARTFTQMPELTGRVKDIYIDRYGQDMYDMYSDVATNTHGGKFHGIPANPPPWSHRPDHDVESIFWVFLFAFVFVKPLNTTDEPSRLFADVCDIFQSHTIVGGQGMDRRSTLLTSFEEDWLDILHPKLSPLVPMMMRLAEQVKPEYGFLDSPPKADHLHEAFRRILLEQILTMEDDPIPLAPYVSRGLPTPDS
ncbi:hypothetical protein QCA50_006871 [Cerrena zonata]|uniref:Fungal-type protein kinase domain-containing protein n=1 Tax=Cerrena zonata TaxID=2478898 RepID=A0AAW0GKQ0_9APHY